MSRLPGPSRCEFSCEVFQNSYLLAGHTDVHAIVAMTCLHVEPPLLTGDLAEILVVPTGASMAGERIEALRTAVADAVDQVPDGVWFALVAGTEVARCAFPSADPGPAMVRLTPATRAEAKEAALRLSADGGRAMGTWLRLATRLFRAVPTAAQRHVVLLTDGRDADETPDELAAAVREATGLFQCDCRGLGSDWDVREVRSISAALLGTVDIVPESRDLIGVLPGLVQAALGRGAADAQLQVWAPRHAEVLFVREVGPRLVDLTSRRTDVARLVDGYPTGAWAEERRDYHLGLRLPPRPVGTELLVGRVQLVVGQEVKAEGLIKAVWSDDEQLAVPLDPAVAHCTGQTELAAAIQEGLAAKAARGDA
jgi:hypothetical protein